MQCNDDNLVCTAKHTVSSYNTRSCNFILSSLQCQINFNHFEREDYIQISLLIMS